MACIKDVALEPKTMAVQVLLAEGEELLALSLTDLLDAEGYDVTVTNDGEKALAAAMRLGNALDALVTDLDMPLMSGQDLIRALRSNRPELPVVVVTGSPPPGGLEELRRQGGGCGPLALLHKPMDCAHFVETLRRAVPPKRF